MVRKNLSKLLETINESEDETVIPDIMVQCMDTHFTFVRTIKRSGIHTCWSGYVARPERMDSQCFETRRQHHLHIQNYPRSDLFSEFVLTQE